MIGVSNFWIVLICLCFVSISSFLLQTHQQAKPGVSLHCLIQPELQFVDKIGPQTTEAQVTSFVNFINSASTFFRTDMKSALGYIGDQMDKAYPRQGSKFFRFSVLLQGDVTAPYFDWSINPQIDYIGVYASVGPGADKIFPNNSYMFALQLALQDHTRTYFDSMTQKGGSIDATLESVIKNTVITLETGTSCVCATYTSQIVAKIREFDNSPYWNIFCSQYPDIHLNVYVNQANYIYIKPKYCYYALYK